MLKQRIKSRLNSWQKHYNHSRFGSCAVLLYHRVTKLDSDPQQLAVSPENFDAQLELLTQTYKVLEISEFQWHLQHQRKFPARSVLITFDDGYADNYLEALPILEKHRVQALFYIATATLNSSKEFWWDEMERLLLVNNNDSKIDSIEFLQEKINLQGLTPSKRMELYTNLLPQLRIQKSDSREDFIEKLAVALKSTSGRASHRALSWDELVKLNASSSAIIGAHTHFHPSLAALTAQEQKAEIENSKIKLEEVLNKKILHFSYPFGTKKDYDQNTLKIVQSLGFELVAANYPALVNCRSDKFQFPRFLVRNWNKETFESELKLFFN